MSRILMVLLTVMGLNAADVPAQLGGVLNAAGQVGGQAASVAGQVLNGGGIGSLGNMQGIAQASMLGGVGAQLSGKAVGNPIYVKPAGFSMSGSRPINVAQTKVAGRSNGIAGISF